MSNIPPTDNAGGVPPVRPIQRTSQIGDENTAAARQRREQQAREYLESLEKGSEPTKPEIPEGDPSASSPRIEAIRTVSTNDLVALLVAAKTRATTPEEIQRIDEMLGGLENADNA